jgi:hypothetical protein
MMARAAGVSVSSVQRLWRAHGLQRHRVRQFKLSNDPKFSAKLRDVVGLYVDPPAHAIVLSVDEKSQIQALDRTQPGLLLKQSRATTMTHDCKRNGTTTLFADRGRERRRHDDADARNGCKLLATTQYYVLTPILLCIFIVDCRCMSYVARLKERTLCGNYKPNSFYV